jgi:hypothetical protein
MVKSVRSRVQGWLGGEGVGFRAKGVGFRANSVGSRF